MPSLIPCTEPNSQRFPVWLNSIIPFVRSVIKWELIRPSLLYLQERRSTRRRATPFHFWLPLLSVRCSSSAACCCSSSGGPAIPREVSQMCVCCFDRRHFCAEARVPNGYLKPPVCCSSRSKYRIFDLCLKSENKELHQSWGTLTISECNICCPLLVLLVQC